MGIYMSWAVDVNSTAQHLPSALPFSKHISAERLQQSLETIIRHRKELHTRIIVDPTGTPRQLADMSKKIPVELKNCSDEEAEKYIHNDFVRPFQEEGPLCRFEILDTSTRTILLTDFHHIIADGQTIVRCLLQTDLPAAYEGKKLMEYSYGMYDRAEAEEASFLSDAYQHDKQYYQRKFHGTTFTRLSEPTSNPEGHVVMATASLCRQTTDEWCQRHAITPHALFMATFSLTLAKLSHEDDVAFALIHHGRLDRHLKNSYGMFVQTVPVQVNIEPDGPVTELVHQCRTEIMASIRHSAYPFTHFCSDMNMTPHITFGFQGENVEEVTRVDGEEAMGIQIPTGTVRHDLNCVIYIRNENYEIRLDSSSNLNSKEQLEMIATAMLSCLNNMMAHPETPVGHIQLTSQAEADHLMRIGKGETFLFDGRETFISLFLRQVEATPESLAVSDEKGYMTYRQLNEASAAWAEIILQNKREKDRFAVIMTVQEKEFLIAAIATQRAGLAYVPISPELNRESVLHILHDCESTCLLTTHKAMRSHPWLASEPLSARLFYIDNVKPTTKIDRRLNLAGPDSLAYMIYTSGTTGKSKGVMVTHRAKLNLIHFIRRKWRLSGMSRISCHSSFSFDASVEDLFPVLTTGGSVHIMSDETRKDIHLVERFIKERGITGGCYTTSFGTLLMKRRGLSLEYICLGGERLNEVPAVPYTVYNTYGPTECTVDTTFFEVPPNEICSLPPIGRPIDNCQLMVADQHGQLLPHGAVGELLVRGKPLAEGYWKDHVLTEKKFTLSTYGNGKSYHTGDFVRWNADGLLEFVGRRDSILKVRGFKVNLSDIEKVFQDIPSLDDVAVCSDGQVILLFYTSSQADDLADDLKRFASFQLPAYAQPQHFVRTDSIPRTTSGKIHYKLLLSEFQQAQYNEGQSDAPMSLWEQLFADVLHISHVMPNDNFFELGGTSISVVHLQEAAHRHGIRLAYQDVFQHPTPDQLKQYLQNKKKHPVPNIPFLVSEYDYSQIHQRLEKAYSLMANRQDKPTMSRNLGHILLTGATGFLGCHLLHNLADSQHGEILCIVRGESQEDAAHHLSENLTYYHGRSRAEAIMKQVGIVSGDLREPISLIPPLQHHSWKWEKEGFQTIIHCAAETHHYSPTLHATNVEGLKNLCQRIRPWTNSSSRFMLISTISVAGLSEGNIPLVFTEKDLYRGQALATPYDTTKLLAERMMLDGTAGFIGQLQIVRLGNLVSSSKNPMPQKGGQSNLFTAMREAILSTGCITPELAEMPIDLSVVDSVGENILQIASLQLPQVIYHLNSRLCQTMLEAVAGNDRIELVDTETFLRRLKGHARSHSAFAPFMSYTEELVRLWATFSFNQVDNQLTQHILAEAHGYSPS